MSLIPAIAADIDSFFIEGEFAQAVTILGGDILAIITDYYDTLQGGTAGIEGAEIILICKSSDVSAAIHGTPVIIGAESFSVVNIRPDNTGITRLQLART